MTTAFNIKQGDYHRRIRLDLTDMTTTDATGVLFRMRLRSGGPLVVDDGAGTIDSTTRVSYQFQGTELDTPGLYDLEASVVFADGTETVPTVGYVTVRILDALE